MERRSGISGQALSEGGVMRYIIRNANAKEVIHAPSEHAAFEEFIRLHPEEIHNAMFLVKEVPPSDAK